MMSISNRDGSEAREAKAVGGKRRQRSVEEKRRIVEETLKPGASVAEVAEARGVNAGQVFKWRRLYRQGLLGAEVSAGALLPVHVSDAMAPKDRTKQCRPTRQSSCARCAGLPGTIHIELAGAHVRIEGNAHPTVLRVLLESLAG
jgi:transposase